jgi:membrane-associated protease RseP (regulator of RpoE activity)
MRRTMMMLAMTVTAMPLMAQDTTIMIQRNNDRTDCTVRVDGRTLSDAQAKPICDRSAERNVWLRFQADSLASRTRELAEMTRRFVGDSFTVAFRGQADMMARELEAARRPFFSNLISLPSKARPIIGVSVDPSPRDTDRYGAYIQAVTPGGPADKAGLRGGDIITAVAGTRIGTTERSRDQSAQSLVSIKLIEVVGGLDAGKAVRIDYRRDDRERSVQVTPVEDRTLLALGTPGVIERYSEYPQRVIDGVPVAPAAPRAGGGTMVPRAGGGFMVATPSMSPFTFTTGPLARIEMAPINEKLGSYFGVTSGVLVVNVPAEGNMNLQPGDVITAVDGRRVETPNEFLRVLRTYDAARTFTLQVTRQKRQESITTKLP